MTTKIYFIIKTVRNKKIHQPEVFTSKIPGNTFYHKIKFKKINLF